MNKLVTGTFVVVFALTAGQAIAQTTPAPTPAPAAKPAASAVDPAVEAKFKSADKNGSGVLEGAELDAFKTNLSKIDTDKDGKVSPVEFAAAAKAGLIK